MKKRTKKSIIAQLTPGTVIWVRNVNPPGFSAWRRRVVVKATNHQLVVTNAEGKQVYNVWSQLLDNGQNDGGFIDHSPDCPEFLEYSMVDPSVDP